MDTNIFKIVLWKEIRDILKDKKTLFLTVLVPFLSYPLILLGTGYLKNVSEEQEAQETVIVGYNGSSRFIEMYFPDSEFENFKWIPMQDGTQSVELKEIQAFLFVPEEFYKESDQVPYVDIYYNNTSDLSGSAARKIETTLEEANSTMLRLRIKEAGLDIDPERMLDYEKKDVSTALRKSGSLAAKAVPFLLVLMLFSGASFAALDIIAGERERGSLESLLTTPADRTAIIAAKFSAVFLTGVGASIVNIIGLSVSVSMGLLDFSGLIADYQFVLSYASLAILLLLMLPAAAFISSLMIIVSSFAESFKQGQYLVFPLFFLTGMPALSGLLPGLKIDSIMVVFPIANIALLAKELFINRYNILFIMLTFGINFLYAGIALRLAVKILNREGIVGFSAISRAERDWTKKAFSLFAFIWLIMFYFATPLQASDILKGLLITEWGFILLPALIFIYINRLDLKKTLSIKKFNPQQAGGAFFAFTAGLLGAVWILHFQSKFFPAPEGLFKAFENMFMDKDISPLMKFIAFAFSAGVCEEVLFRGVLTDVLSRKHHKAFVIIVVSLLFGIFHFNIYRILPTAVVGAVLTWTLLETRSIFLPIIMHILHNSTLIFLDPEFLSSVSKRPEAPLYILISLFIASVLFSGKAWRRKEVH